MAGDAEATARLVQLAMRKLGFEGKGARGKLAEAIGMPPYGDNNGMVRKWLRGEHAPRAEYMVEMLSQAGLLTPEADRAWRGERRDPRAAAEAAAEAAGSVQEALRRHPERKRGSG
jgi:hypothetical protein